VADPHPPQAVWKLCLTNREEESVLKNAMYREFVKMGMSVRTSAANTCVIVVLLMTSAYALGQSCPSGDCQLGAIAGPYSAAQTAENTASNFSVCQSSGCLTGSWTTDQIEGMDAQQNIGSSYQFFDTAYNLDTNIAVGPAVNGANAQVLQWVNFQSVQAFDKVTGNPIFTNPSGTTAVPQSVAGLWSSSTQPECQSGAVDAGNVQVIYDRLDNEFAISMRVAYGAGGVTHYAFCLALSSGSDLSSAATVWYAYEYKMDSAIPCLPSSVNCTTGSEYYYFPDWPRIGTWSNGFYITFDLQNPASDYVEAGSEVCQLDRADMVLGQAANPMTCYTYIVPAISQPSLIHSLDVADIDSPTGPSSAEPEYFLAIVNPSNAQQDSNGTRRCTSQTTPCTSNQLALFTWGSTGLSGPTFLAVNAYTPGCYDTSAAGREPNTVCVPEPSTNPADIGAYGAPSCGDYSTPCVDSLGDRMSNRLTYNNLSSSGSGPNGEYLTASHVVMESANNQSVGIRYYVFDVSDGTASVLVNSGGTTGPPDLEDPSHILSYFMPSVALDKNGDLGVAYTVSGPNCSTCETQPYPAVYFQVLPWASVSLNPTTLIISGSGDEENTYHWGQYAATVLDPSDNLTFYGIGEYFDTSQTGTSTCWEPASDCYTWQTRILRGQYGDGFPTQLVAVAPAALSYGNQTVGTTSAGQTVTLTNKQSTALTISSVTTSGDFGQTNTCGSSVAALGTCTIAVTFTPTADGIRTGQVTISDGAAGSPQVINLTGTGGSALVTLGQTSLSFKSFPQITTATKTVKLTNSGSATLSVSSITASGDYAVNSNCVGSIAAGKACNLTVSFTPSVIGTIPGEITIADNAPGAPHLIQLTGTGLTTVGVAPSSLTFAATSVGSSSADEKVTITNNASTSQTLSYGVSGDFTVEPGGSTPCSATQPVTLNPGSICTLSVGFSPTAAGSIKGAVTVTDTASGLAYNPLLVNLTGTATGGTTTALSGSPDTVGFGNVVVGSSSGSQTITVKNTSTSPVSILSLAVTGDFALESTGKNRCVAGTTIVLPGKTCGIPVTVTPNQSGFLEGAVTLTDNAASGPTTQVFGLTVTGVWPVSLSPGKLTFPAQSVGTTSTAEIVTVSNYSSSVVTLNSIVPSGNFAVVSGGSSPCGTSIPSAVGQKPGTCTFGVTFTPPVTGAIEGAVTVSHNAAGSNSPQIVSLTGTGQ
jgi:Protein of unknown function (DUF1573)